MRKLIDRLKPEYKVKLAEVQSKYPAIFERTMIALNEEVIYGDLKVYEKLVVGDNSLSATKGQVDIKGISGLITSSLGQANQSHLNFELLFLPL
mgnify:CR=1 FL=1